MTFDEYWNGICTRNKWKPDMVVQCKVSGLRKLVEDSYNKGVESQDKTNDLFDSLLKSKGVM